MKAIGIAMSGGVDSSVSASLLKLQGHDVHGYFMRLPLPGVEKHLARVGAVAEQLAIPLTVVDMEDLFTARVMDLFTDTYRRGQTPNPCVVCNRQIKFGALRRYMINRGMNMIATGHYARIARTDNGLFVVQRGRDERKDQSYFLCRLDQEQLASMVLPLGEKTKAEVYRMAQTLGLTSVHGPESQDVCFLAGRSIADFFREQGIPETPGDIVASDGRILGRHRGLWHYTIGQRRGLALPDATPWYVQRLDTEANRVFVCKNEGLMTSHIRITDVRWAEAPPSAWEGLVQVRGRHRPSPALVEQVLQDTWLVTFTEPQRAVAPGQYAAFYAKDKICGSGIITGQEWPETGGAR